MRGRKPLTWSISHPGEQRRSGAYAVCQTSDTIMRNCQRRLPATLSPGARSRLHCGRIRFCFFARLPSSRQSPTWVCVVPKHRHLPCCSCLGMLAPTPSTPSTHLQPPPFYDRGSPVSEHVTLTTILNLICAFCPLCPHPLSVSPWQSCIRRLPSAPSWPRRSRCYCFLHSTSAAPHTQRLNPLHADLFSAASRPTLRSTAIG